MTVPADGVDRLIYFVDARIAQLNLSKEEVARRGGPARDTLAKIRGRADQHTPLVGTLLRNDAAPAKEEEEDMLAVFSAGRG